MTFNTIATSISSVLILIGTITKSIALYKNSEHKKMIISALILSIIALILLSLISFKDLGKFAIIILIFSFVLILISLILCSIVAYKVSKDPEASKSAIVISSIISGLVLIIIGFLLFMHFFSNMQNTIIQTSVQTKVEQLPPYDNPMGAQEQLSQLKINNSLNPNAQTFQPTRSLNPNAPIFQPNKNYGML